MARRLATEPQPPPMPADPQVCRWCRSTREVVAGYWLCPRGCAANDVMPNQGRCADCRREYATGGRELHQCHECSDRDMRLLTKEYAGALPRSGWLRDMVRKGANVHAVEQLRKDGDG